MVDVAGLVGRQGAVLAEAQLGVALGGRTSRTVPFVDVTEEQP